VSVEPERRDLVFVFQKAPRSSFHFPQSHAVGIPQLRRCFDGPCADDIQLPVPVGTRPVIEDSNGPIRVEGDFIKGNIFSSVVRLYSFNEGPTLLREWLNLESILDEIPPPRIDGKLQHGIVRGWQLSGRDYRCVINGVVES